MDRRYVLALVLGLVLIAGWSLAQQADTNVGAANQSFAVSTGAEKTVLVETRTGQTWILNRAYDGQYVWLPIQRINLEVDAAQWRQEQQKQREELETLRQLEEQRRREELGKSFREQAK